MRFMRFLTAVILAGCAVAPALAGTDTDTFDVSLTIQAACEVTADNDLAFGTQSFLDQPIDAQVDFNVQCTTATIGTISLDDGTGASGLVTLRTMELGGGEIEYGLYTTAARTTYWGDGTGGSSTVSHTGTGAETPLTIYARTSVQAEPVAGTYTDTITVTVTY